MRGSEPQGAFELARVAAAIEKIGIARIIPRENAKPQAQRLITDSCPGIGGKRQGHCAIVKISRAAPRTGQVKGGKRRINICQFGIGAAPLVGQLHRAVVERDLVELYMIQQATAESN